MRIRTIALLLLLSIPAPALTVPRDTTHFILPWARTPKSWDVDLAPADEPGPRLEMSGRVLGQRDRLPDLFLRPAMTHAPPSGDEHAVPGVRVYAYHADARGYYALPGEARFGERIAGVLRTNRNGEYRIRTIVPGQYAGPPHIHFEIWGPTLARRVMFVNLHASPGVSVPGWKKEINPGARWLWDAYVTLDSAGLYHAKFDLHLNRTYASNAALDSLRRITRPRFMPRG